MAAAAAVVAHAWTEWGIQALVLLSFTLQVTLLVLAEFRRRVDSGVLRFFVWSAYVLADATAIFVLGHLSATSRSREHELMAFWAPLLLVHLGGQDNITAYAIEDNSLWLRHLQTLAVQVVAVAYVLYQSSILGSSPSSLLGPAIMVMFVVGVLKYGERVWALWCAGGSTIGSNYRSSVPYTGEFLSVTHSIYPPVAGDWDAQDVLHLARQTLDVAREYLKGPLLYDLYYELSLSGEVAYKVAEMHISLMHGIYYTKAEVMRSWYGRCIRLISLLATPVALILFHVHVLGHGRKVGYIRADVAVTYVLLAGAVVLEIAAASRAVFWSEAWAFLSRRAPYSVFNRLPEFLHFLSRVVVSLRQLVHAADHRQWSGSMGQHNVLRLCARIRTSPWSRMASRIGVEDWWNTLAYSWSVPVSTRIRMLVVTQVIKSRGVPEASEDHIVNSRGRAALKNFEFCQDLDWSVDPEKLSLEVSILVWHIATNIYLSWYKDQPKDAGGQEEEEDIRTDEAAEVLSNYMLFLLATRPYMLPAPASRSAYIQMCYGLTCPLEGPPEDLANLLRRYGNALNNGSRFPFDYVHLPPQAKRDSLEQNETLKQGCKLGAKLISKVMDNAPRNSHAAADMLELIAQVWTEILCYVGHRCSSYSHAKQISNGGELITVAAILVQYLKKGILRANS